MSAAVVSLKVALVIVSHLLLCHHSQAWFLPWKNIPHYEITVDAGHEVSNLTHFWRSTGMCPPDPHQKSYKWFLGQDMTHNLAFIGAIPRSGIKQVRMHYLLDLLTITSFHNKKPVYNFTLLDRLLDTIRHNNLIPGFEIMGNPSNFYSNFDDKSQVYLWRDMVTTIAGHYVARYGLDYVATWNFESWNEPDSRRAFEYPLHVTPSGYMNYYDACSEGLRQVHPSLKFGGPADNLHVPPHPHLSWGVLDHVVNGHNFFTGEKGVRIDYIAVHDKGHIPDNSEFIFKHEQDQVADIRKLYPSLTNIPFVNDEGDPLVGWATPLWFRAAASYPAMVAKVIFQHQDRILSKPGNLLDYKLISNDNGFLSYRPHFFTQRTLLARFQMNITKPPHVQFIRKPVYSVMGLLALLGERQLKTTIVLQPTDGSKKKVPISDVVGALASVHHPDPKDKHDSWDLTVLTYFSMDTMVMTGQTKIHLNITNVPKINEGLMWVQYDINNEDTNPYQIWKDAGAPQTPNPRILQEMRDHEGPIRKAGPLPFSTRYKSTFTFTISLPGVSLFHVCAKSSLPPGQVTNLTIYTITNNQILLTWSDREIKARCIKTYEVQFSPTAEGPFHRINAQDTIFNSFVYAPNVQLRNAPVALRFATDTVSGYYRVHAVDFWNRPGTSTPPIRYSGQDTRL